MKEQRTVVAPYPHKVYIRELKQPRRQRQGKRHFENDFQIFQTFSR